MPHPDPTIPGQALPIVVGAHVRAEVEDRPIAEALRRALDGPARLRGLAPVVVTDLWYLNTEPLRSQPTVAIGRPEINALSAFLADKLPSVLAVDDRLVVLLDPELADPAACCWGRDAAATAEAVRAFSERWSERFLLAASGAA